MATNTIDELMRRPADQFQGPKDPNLWELVLYLRQERMKTDAGKKPKRSEIAEKADPDLLKIVMDGRKVTKRPTYRRS